MGASRERIAILGGGPAGVAAAFELTATPELRDRYEVTVHTLGHRLGGKGASGRNPAHAQRIEEHGLHVWFGFYENAFALMRRCYHELDRPPGTPLATLADAFKGCPRVLGVERFGDRTVVHEVRMPGNQRVPGDGSDFGYWEVVAGALARLESHWGRHAVASPAPAVEVEGAHLRVLAERLGRDVEGVLQRGAAGALELARRLAEHHRGAAERALAQAATATLAHLVCRARDWTWRHVVRDRVAEDGLRLDFMVLDFAAAVLTGIAGDRLLERGFGGIDDVELRDWLRRHGASEMTVEQAPFVRAIYDAAFCYVDGDLARPNIAAGKGLQDFIRTALLYKGALFFKMQAGMGDTVFAPLYEVLRRRGVRFEFFRAATRLRVADGMIDAVEIVPQVALRGTVYRPLVDVGGLPCWPSEPLWDQLDLPGGARPDFERELDPLGRGAVTLRRGEHFDRIVLAIPTGAQKGSLCEELRRHHPAYDAMLAASHTVRTQAFQLWLTRRQEGEPAPLDRDMVLVASPAGCGMAQLVAREAWPESAGVRDVAYFCEVLADDAGASQREADEAVRRHTLDLLGGALLDVWPGAARDGGFDWDLLADPQGRSGVARLEAQYLRANVSPSERYVLTTAGSVSKRLAPGASGFANLVLAGDWTRNGIDGGSVEAAVTSGMLAARAISGHPARVPGVAGWLESDRGPA